MLAALTTEQCECSSKTSEKFFCRKFARGASELFRFPEAATYPEMPQVGRWFRPESFR
jgi:hypothetical protein